MVKQFFNDAQQYLLYVNARDTIVTAGRGFGKGVLHAYRMLRYFQTMPGCNIGIVAANCKRCLVNTLPSLLIHWERWGYKRGIHYAIGMKPQKQWGWKKPIFEPANYENVITFYNGSIATIISQDRSGTSNSLSLDGLDIDEAKFIDFEQLKDETFQANRGNEMYFGHCSLHHGMLVTSDMPTTKAGRWFLKYEEEMDKNLIRMIESLVYEIWRVKQKCKASPDYASRHRKDLYQLNTYLEKLRSQAVLYKEYSSVENLALLSEEYLKRMKRELPKLTFATSIMSLRMDFSADGFYSGFSDNNLYSKANQSYIDSLQYNFDPRKDKTDCRMDGDLEMGSPLIISFDYNALINWLVVGQIDERNNLRVLKSFYVKYERKIPELLDDFDEYYRFMLYKKIIFYYDATAVGNNYALKNDDFHKYIVKRLKRKGWAVKDVYVGKPMAHHLKQFIIYRMMVGRAAHQVLVNRDNNEDLIIAIKATGVYNGGKDKRGEKLAETETDRLEARTDGTDAFDTLCIGVEKFPQLITHAASGGFASSML
ncbi:MAG: hypothetical protein MJZ08_02540 [Bacteroidaceae bacterium]|nr:hypothetical protein [Bacteroidaceae bacterium]